MQTFAEDTSPRRGLKASISCYADAAVLDSASPAGVVVVATSTAHHVDLPSATGDTPVGVIAYDVVQDLPTVSTDDFDADEAIDVVREGQIWCVAEETLTIGSQPYFRHTANGGNTTLGALRSDADTNNADLLPNSRVIAVATGLAKIAINLPYGAAA